VAADTTIATLRLRSAGRDTPALRLRAARQLQAAALAPAGVPPAAVLVVRRLTDPMPGRFGGNRLRPHPEWERAVRDELAALARAAARPDGSGRLPADAPAVLFGDEAELVACLLGDRARGEAAAHWWWRSVLPRLALPGSLAHDAGRDPALILCARPREVPAAVALLARWGEAGRVAAALPATGAARALAALTREHSLPAGLVAPSGLPIDVVGSASRPASAHAARDPAAADAVFGPMPSPWAEWAPLGVEDGRVPPEVHCLFAVAAGLHAAPARVRSPAVVLRARTWWAVVTGAVPKRDPIATRTAPPTPAAAEAAQALDGGRPAVGDDAPRQGSARQARAVDGTPRAASAAGEVGLPPPSRRGATAPVPGNRTASRQPSHARAPRDTVAPATAAAPAAESPARHDRGSRGDRRRSAAVAAPSRRRRHQAATATANTPQHPRAAVTQAEAPEPASGLPGDGLSTRLGGLFFLIHALQDLELPDTFDLRWHADAGGPWGTLDLLARALLGPRFLDVRADPAWTALAALADWGPRRTRASRGGGAYDPPFRVPAMWHKRLRDPLDHLCWATARGRLWIWSAAGHLVAHRRWRGAPLAAVRREAALLLADGARAAPRLEARAAHEMPWIPPPSAPGACPPRLRRWAGAVAPAVRRRLALALDGSEDVATHLMVPARLYLTSSHVDVVLSAQDADLRVRAAGLDRDPGWLPAYGRVVYFHFE